MSRRMSMASFKGELESKKGDVEDTKLNIDTESASNECETEIENQTVNSTRDEDLITKRLRQVNLVRNYLINMHLA